MLKGMTNVALRSVISLEISRHPLIQSDARLKPTRLGYSRDPALQFSPRVKIGSPKCFFVLIGCSVYSDLVS